MAGRLAEAGHGILLVEAGGPQHSLQVEELILLILDMGPCRSDVHTKGLGPNKDQNKGDRHPSWGGQKVLQCCKCYM